MNKIRAGPKKVEKGFTADLKTCYNNPRMELDQTYSLVKTGKRGRYSIVIEEPIVRYLHKQYKTGIPVKNLAKQVGVSANRIWEHFHKYLLPLHHRHYTVNDNYFKDPLDEHKAYWIGFLLADGNISKRDLRIHIGVKSSDKYHLHKFKNDLQMTNPIYHSFGTCLGKKYPFTCVRFTSSQIVEDLSKYQIVPKKSLNYTTPNIPKHLKSHFYRGYFDGDGGICYSPIKNTHRLTCCGPEQFIIDFRDWIISQIGRDPRYPNSKNYGRAHKGKELFSLKFGGKQRVAKVIALLYKNADIYLDRKMELARTFFV